MTMIGFEGSQQTRRMKVLSVSVQLKEETSSWHGDEHSNTKDADDLVMPLPREHDLRGWLVGAGSLAGF
jgi:hypothetical protein